MKLLVVMREARKHLVRGEVPDMQDGQGQAPEAAWQAAASRGYHVEVGTYHDGFYYQAAEDDEGLQRHLGHYGSIDQEPTF